MCKEIIYIALIVTFLVSNCSLSYDLHAEETSTISWEDLQITPRSNENLCADISVKDLDWETMKRDFTSGLFGGIFPDDLSKLDKLSDGTLWVESNEPVLLRWRFWYPPSNERPANLRLFILLDEHQLTDALPEPGLYNDINLQQGDDIALKVSLPPLAPGVHDVIAIGVPYPEDYPNEHGIVRFVSWRITLIAKPFSSPFREITFRSLYPEGSLQKNDPLIYLVPTLKKDGLDVWNWPNPWLDVNVNNDIQFFALAGYNHVENLDAPSLDQLKASFFSLLLLVDYQQMEFAEHQTAFYGRVDNDTAYSRVPVKVKPLSVGKHIILLIRIDTPGVPLCVLRDDPKGRILPNSIYGSLVGINVLPPK
jgi:hypothetical protein